MRVSKMLGLPMHDDDSQGSFSTVQNVCNLIGHKSILDMACGKKNNMLQDREGVNDCPSGW